MALLSDLVRIVASVEGLEEVSVGIFARHAREAGLISQGGRGRSAARMTVTDAANLLIAVNGCGLAKEVASRVPKIRALPADKFQVETAVGIGKDGSSFGADLENLLGYLADPSRKKKFGLIPGSTYVRFFRPSLIVAIQMNPYRHGDHQKEEISYGYDLLDYDPDKPDRSDEAVISIKTLIAVAQAI